MKIAVLSDIHSNIYALEAVLHDATINKAEAIVNLGDSLYGPIEPRATYELIRESQLINIMGNQDRELLEATLDQLEKNDTLRFAYNQIGEDALYWIQDLPFEKLIGQDFYLIHGTYFDDTQYLLEDVSKGKPQLRDEEQIIKLLDDIKSTFVLCGHSCVPRFVNLSSNQLVINPGSVGLQAVKENTPNDHVIENGTPDASYVLLTIENGEYNVELKRVAYDYEKAAQTAEKNGRPDWAHALRTGQVLKD